MREPRKTKLGTTSKSRPAHFPRPMGIWYTDDTMFTDPDKVTAAECELMAILPADKAHEYARYLYEESQTESDNWQTVQIFARPADREGWHLSQGYDRTTNADPIVTALVDALAREFGGVWEVTPTGGGCDAITCDGLLTDARRATLVIVAQANAPVLGVDEGCSVIVLPKYASGEDGQTYDTTARTGYLSGVEVADLVAFAIADTRFTPLPVVV